MYIYIYMAISIYSGISHIYIYIHEYMHAIYIYIYICTYVCIYVYMQKRIQTTSNIEVTVAEGSILSTLYKRFHRYMIISHNIWPGMA